MYKGCQWRIDSGHFVKIYKDPQILGLNTNELTDDSEVEDSRDDTGSSLIDESTQWWNVEKVRALFNPHIAERTLKIIIYPSSNIDKWIQLHEKNGILTVRSAYKRFQSRLKQTSGESSMESKTRVLWTNIWQMKIPNKNKVFARRACVDGLFQNLQKKHVAVENKCVFNPQRSEDISHALFFCPPTQNRWNEYFPYISTKASHSCIPMGYCTLSQ